MCLLARYAHAGAMVEALSKASPDVKKKLLLQVRG
jgi:hypothetical protein